MPGSGSLSLSIVRLSPLNVDVCVYNTRGLYRRRAARYNLPRGVYARSRRDAEFSSAARLIYRDGALYVCVCVCVPIVSWFQRRILSREVFLRLFVRVVSANGLLNCFGL